MTGGTYSFCPGHEIWGRWVRELLGTSGQRTRIVYMRFSHTFAWTFTLARCCYKSVAVSLRWDNEPCALDVVMDAAPAHSLPRLNRWLTQASLQYHFIQPGRLSKIRACFQQACHSARTSARTSQTIEDHVVDGRVVSCNARGCGCHVGRVVGCWGSTESRSQLLLLSHPLIGPCVDELRAAEACR